MSGCTPLRVLPTSGPWLYVVASAAAKSLQSCLTLCDPIYSSPPGSAVPGILQARTLEWVAISFSRLYVTAAQLIGPPAYPAVKCRPHSQFRGQSHPPAQCSSHDWVLQLVQGGAPPTSSSQQLWLGPHTHSGVNPIPQCSTAAATAPKQHRRTCSTGGTLLEHLALAARQDCTSDPHNTSPKWGYCCKTERKADIPNT